MPAPDPTTPPSTPENAPVQGRYLARWRVRAIRCGNVVAIEFLDRPWYTESSRRREARLVLLHRALRLSA